MILSTTIFAVFYDASQLCLSDIKILSLTHFIAEFIALLAGWAGEVKKFGTEPGFSTLTLRDISIFYGRFLTICFQSPIFLFEQLNYDFQTQIELTYYITRVEIIPPVITLKRVLLCFYS